MFDNLTNYLAPLTNISPQLFRQRHFLVITFIIIAVPTFENVEVDARAFAREDFGAHAFLAEVDLRAVDGVHKDGGQVAEDLEREVGGFDDVH